MEMKLELKTKVTEPSWIVGSTILAYHHLLFFSLTWLTYLQSNVPYHCFFPREFPIVTMITYEHGCTKNSLTFFTPSSRSICLSSFSGWTWENDLTQGANIVHTILQLYLNS